MKTMTTTKQAAAGFSFKRNADVQALPEAVPPVALAEVKAGRRVAVRKDHQVSGYLSEAEYQAFVAKLDGRPIAAVVRNLVLKYTTNG